LAAMQSSIIRPEGQVECPIIKENAIEIP